MEGKRSYPTYEEWKHNGVEGICFSFNSSYPTYEEWKHFNIPLKGIASGSSYPTYEEWKLPTVESTSNTPLAFLSYL